MTPTDAYVFVGNPPLIRPRADEVHVSVAFTWDIDEAFRLVDAWGQHYSKVAIGGPALGTPCNQHTAGEYIKQGVTFTSRGCNNHCPWCLVPEREGKLRTIEHFAEGNVVQDNNLLQADHRHIKRVFEMLKTQHLVSFTGGLDARLITDAVVDDLRNLSVYQLFLACDSKGAIKALRQAVAKLAMRRDQMRCYVLLCFENESLSDAEARLEDVWSAGCLPFPQLYQPPDHWITYEKPWRDLARRWARPAITKAIHKAQQV